MIDAHHHIWRQQDLPWLVGPEQPRIFGPYAAIRRDYLLEEYQRDLGQSGITASVYVQANWAPDQGLAEAQWVQAESDRTGWPMAIVAYADMTRPDCADTLLRLTQVSNVRGIRHQFHWHEHPLYRFAPHPDLCSDPVVRHNVAVLGELGLSFDLQVFGAQMPGAAQLAQACPDVTFVLQHAGMLVDDNSRGTWEQGLEALARCPNVMCKISGLGTFRQANDPAHIADQARTALRLFGAERCLYGSNYPIEKLWTTYDALWAATRNAVPAAHHNAVFHDTAHRVYRMADLTKGDA